MILLGDICLYTISIYRIRGCFHSLMTLTCFGVCGVCVLILRPPKQQCDDTRRLLPWPGVLLLYICQYGCAAEAWARPAATTTLLATCRQVGCLRVRPGIWLYRQSRLMRLEYIVDIILICLQ